MKRKQHNNPLHLISLNVRGLRDIYKRRKVFKWFDEQKADIVFIQETHYDKASVNAYDLLWKGASFHSLGTSNSRGVSILLKPELDIKDIKCKYIDKEGRLLIINLKYKKNTFNLINVYAPNNYKERLLFFKKLENKIHTLCNGKDEYTLMGGDMNCILQYKLDQRNSIHHSYDKSPLALKNCMNKHNLSDIWRKCNENKTQFTWRRKNIYRRLDFWCISNSLYKNGEVINTDIRPSIFSDHQVISLRILHDEEKRGPGIWKLNNSFLIEDEYTRNVYKLIENTKKNEHNLNPALLWEYLKVKIKEFSCKYGKKREKQKNKNKEKLRREIVELATQLDIVYDKKKDKLLKNKINDLDNIYLLEAKGAQIRSRVQWFEKGEKNTKFFIGLEKHNAKKKHITSVLKNNGKYTSNTKEILKEQVNFFKQLYQMKEISNSSIHKYINSSIVNTLSVEDKNKCEGLLTLEECKDAVFKMCLNKSPGTDGLTVEFYRKFWDAISCTVCGALNFSYENDKLSTTQRRGIINLLYKKGERENLTNWRPITLLNVDYKIAAHVLANRMQSVISSVINHDQKGYIHGRFAGESIRLIEDLLEYTNINNKKGALIFIDFEKAFDSVDRNFMLKSLKYFGFGKEFIHWVEVMYTDTESCCINNGWTSESFIMNGGIRQGCPMSSLLFILVVELMACNIRNNPMCKGIALPSLNEVQNTVKIAQLADDTVIFANDENSISSFIKEIELFCEVSGLKLNKKKNKRSVDWKK